jgi:hypothetical protein
VDRESEPSGKVFDAEQQPLQGVWPKPRIHAEVWDLPNLLPGNGIAGTSPWRYEVELVID